LCRYDEVSLAYEYSKARVAYRLRARSSSVLTLVDTYEIPSAPFYTAHLNLPSPPPPSPPPPPPLPPPPGGRRRRSLLSGGGVSGGGGRRELLQLGLLQQKTYELKVGTTEIVWNVSAAAEFVHTAYFLKAGLYSC
jgi:hypothetical protein